MEFFKCPVCNEKVKVTSEGINHSGSNPFHFYRYSVEELKSQEKFYENCMRRMLYRNPFHQTKTCILVPVWELTHKEEILPKHGRMVGKTKFKSLVELYKMYHGRV